jgi:hypothetical protein
MHRSRFLIVSRYILASKISVANFQDAVVYSNWSGSIYFWTSNDSCNDDWANSDTLNPPSSQALCINMNPLGPMASVQIVPDIATKYWVQWYSMY